MGALVAVVYVLMHGRFRVRPRNLVWGIAAFGHTFTITTRGHLYLTMVACSLILLGAAVFLARRLCRRFTMTTSVVLSAIAFLAVYGVLIGLLPSLGDLSANVAASSNQFGYARAATETPQPIVNILSTPLTVNSTTYAPGQIVYPGFDADVLSKFRWYSLLNQLLVWTVIALAFGALLERFLEGRTRQKKRRPIEQAAPVAPTEAQEQEQEQEPEPVTAG